MGEYTVKAGENLWNICKREFKLTNNTDIANKVNEVIKANGITTPNYLKIGQKINIDFSKSTNEQKTYSQEVNQAVTDKINFNNIKTYADIERLKNSSVSIFGANTVSEGKQSEAYNDYSAKLLLDYYDIDKDGTVTEEEFAQVEQSDNEKQFEIDNEHFNNVSKAQGHESVEFREKEMNAIKAPAQRSANLFAQNLDFNDNGKIDAEELAFFNQMADKIDGKADGVILQKSETAMFKSVTGANADNEEYNRVVNKYLRGETLTAEEQKTLEESQKAIKAALRKSSGLNFEG